MNFSDTFFSEFNCKKIGFIREDIEMKYKKMRKTVTRCNDIFTFDIEVTSAFIKPNGVVIPYKPGYDNDYWNELDKLALPYIWQFSVNA